jgi:hypothetical protein
MLLTVASSSLTMIPEALKRSEIEFKFDLVENPTE